jgi:hypothetical protein
MQDAIHADTAQTSAADSAREKPKHRHGPNITNLLKCTTKAAVETKARGRFGASSGWIFSRTISGFSPRPNSQRPTRPVDFEARYKDRRGWIYTNTLTTIPASLSLCAWRPAAKAREPTRYQKAQRIGGLDWEARPVAGWASDRNVIDSLETVGKHGNSWRMTANCPER